MADIFQSGISGLFAAQRSLATTSHNISNVNTEGYSRQRVEQGARAPTATGAGFIGNGVETTGVRRVFDQVRETAVQTNTSEFKRLDSLAEFAGRIDDLVADEDAGLSPALQDFFGAVQDVANDPTSSTARQALLGEGENLAGRLQFLDGRFRAIDQDLDRQIETQTEEVNELAQAIAGLNEDIVAERGRTGGEPPNDLLDKRDALLRDLSERVATRSTEQENGAINVEIGNGQSLVSGFSASRIEAIRSADDPSRRGIAIEGGDGDPVDITSAIQGGTLGGALDFRREVLDPTWDDLGRISTTLAVSVNQQQNRGLQFDGGPEGALGEDFFRVPQPPVIARDGNSDGLSGAPEAAINEGDVDALTGDNYRLRYDGSDWMLRNEATGETSDPPDGDDEIAFQGLTVDTGDLANPEEGDAFLIRPTRLGASDLEVALDRPGQVAAASPLRAGQATDGDGQGVNAGSGAIEDLEVNGTDQLGEYDDGITLRFDAGSDQFSVRDAGDNEIATIAYDPDTDSAGKTIDSNDITGLPGDISFTLSGVPEDGDELVIEKNTGATGDNSNALKLGELTDESILNGGETTFQEAYSDLVGQVGNSTRQAQVNRDAQESALEQAREARESLSGVNLDEEAANLIKFQQAYQASSQAIAVGNQLFDSLLAAVQR